MVIQFLWQIVLTALPYFTSYASAYLQHFDVKMCECRSVLRWSIQYDTQCVTQVQGNILKEATWLVEVKLASSKWTNQEPYTVWSLAICLLVVHFRHVPECHIFNSLGIVFLILGLSEGSTTLKKWLYYLCTPTTAFWFVEDHPTGAFK